MNELGYTLDGPEDAPVLVLSASLGATGEMWLPQVAALSERRRLVRIDHPGHGRSPVWEGPVTVDRIGGAALDLLDALGYRQVSWCGLSLGGAIAQWVAAHAPDRIDRLILCCTAARMSPPEAYRERAALVRAEGVAAVAGRVLERWFTLSFRESKPEVVARFRAMLESIPTDGYAACCEAVADFDARPYLSQIAAPTLVIAGEEDQATPVDQMRALADGIRGARLEVISGAAHIANVAQPEQVNAAIAAHLDADEGRGRDG